MAQPKRNDPAPWSPPAPRYSPGGDVGQMQADLRRRLAGDPDTARPDPTPGERAVRLVSVAGGWATLAVAYGAIAYLLWL